VSAAENAALDDEYRCIFVTNMNTTYAWYDVVLWIQSTTAGAPSYAVGVDPTAASAHDSASAQAVEIADEDSIPAGVAFTAPADKTSGIALGDIGPGECRAFWIRRTAIGSGAISDAGFQMRVEGNTEAP